MCANVCWCVLEVYQIIRMREFLCTCIKKKLPKTLNTKKYIFLVRQVCVCVCVCLLLFSVKVAHSNRGHIVTVTCLYLDTCVACMHVCLHTLTHSPSRVGVKDTRQVRVKPTEPHHTSQHDVLLRC